MRPRYKNGEPSSGSPCRVVVTQRVLLLCHDERANPLPFASRRYGGHFLRSDGTACLRPRHFWPGEYPFLSEWYSDSADRPFRMRPVQFGPTSDVDTSAPG